MAERVLPSFQLHPGIDARALAESFQTHRRVRIDPFLDANTASMLEAAMLARSDWKMVFNSGDKVYEVPRDGPDALDPAQEARLRGAIDASGREAFQYCFDSIRVPDDRPDRSASDPLHRFADFLCSDRVLALVRTITGASRIAFADAQGTRYRPGDFLTAHDDAVEGKNRAAAYVLSLSDEWRPEWGGLLLFHDPDGVHGFVPRRNALTLFAVPQAHSVSQVATIAARPRCSVTGWFRTG